MRNLQGLRADGFIELEVPGTAVVNAVGNHLGREEQAWPVCSTHWKTNPVPRCAAGLNPTDIVPPWRSTHPLTSDKPETLRCCVNFPGAVNNC